MENRRMEIGEKIRLFREERKMSQEELARRLFLTRQAISKYETGKSFPSIDVLRLLAKEMGESLDSLLEVGEEKKGGGESYKPLGYRHFGFAVIYSLMILFATAVFAVLLIEDREGPIYSKVLYIAFFAVLVLMISYLLVQSLFPTGRILVEYSGEGLLLHTIRGKEEISYSDILGVDIRTHGNWSSGRLTVVTDRGRFSVYPLKNLNEVKTTIDELVFLAKKQNRAS